MKRFSPKPWKTSRRPSTTPTRSAGRTGWCCFPSAMNCRPIRLCAPTPAIPRCAAFTGKHLSVSNRTPTEIALARLIDGAMDYELTRYGQRHLYCHTSWTHIGPLTNRPDLEVPKENAINPDLGDLVCLNVYTYARGVRTSPPGSVTGTSYQGYLEELAAAD